jgi:hypothetical protein
MFKRSVFGGPNMLLTAIRINRTFDRAARSATLRTEMQARRDDASAVRTAFERAVRSAMPTLRRTSRREAVLQTSAR